MPRCKDAWDIVVEARAAYLAGEWSQADDRLRAAIKTAAEALILYYNLEPTAPDSYELAQRACREVFGDRLINRIFDRADILSSLMPLGDVVDDHDSREARRSVAASSELVALVESYVFL